MDKQNVKSMPVITIHIDKDAKQSLQKKANDNGLQLTAYCRMVLLNDIKEDR